MLLPLIGCGGSAGIDPRPVVELRSALARPPAVLTEDCPGPLELPPGDLSRGGVERGWGRDRAALAECRKKHRAVVDFYVNRDAGLAGGK